MMVFLSPNVQVLILTILSLKIEPGIQDMILLMLTMQGLHPADPFRTVETAMVMELTWPV